MTREEVVAYYKQEMENMENWYGDWNMFTSGGVWSDVDLEKYKRYEAIMKEGDTL